MSIVSKADAVKRSKASLLDCRDFDLETGEEIKLVREEFKDECDINVLLSRYTPEQLQDRLAAVEGVFGDYSDVMSYAEAKQLVIDADNAFMSLDAKIRREFDHDPQAFVDFMSDPNNDERAIELGLKRRDSKEESVAPPKVEVGTSEKVG